MMRTLIATVLLVCSGNAADLSDRLDAALAGVPKGGIVGVAVLSADGALLYHHDADRSCSLASTTKTLIAGAALFQLTPNYHFQTRLVSIGTLTDGSLPSLGIIGGGDPTIDDHFAPDNDPNKILGAWIDELKRRGIRRITGDIVIDGSLFSGPIRPSTYPQDNNNPQKWHSAPASAFAFNDNCIEARVIPTTPGGPGRIITRPSSPRIVIRNQTRTGTSKQNNTVVINRDIDANRLSLSGTCTKDGGWLEAVSIFEDPDLLAGDHFKNLLTAQGISVAGTVRRGDVARDAPTLVERSQELIPALDIYLRRSQNFYGEQLLRLVGHAVKGEGSIDAGTTAVLSVLRKHLGDRAPSATLLDGSGLSYGNKASALDMTQYLAALAKSPIGPVFIRCLKDRDIGTIRGKVKTGTLAIACTLVGYLDAPDGRRWCFAILCNQGEATSFAWAPKVRDRLLDEMAAVLKR